jgi:hypothetical protein
MSSSYPTQEDELRAAEAEAENLKQAEETKFLSLFHSTPKRNTERLSELASVIVNNFNGIMAKSRVEPYQKQEDLMAGLRKLFEEQINVIEARRAYTIKINPSSTGLKEEHKNI